MKLIIGLGNPGKEYKHTRHNVGFLMVDALAKEWGITFLEKAKLHAQIAEVIIEGEKVWLIKPTIFYNLTGEAVRKIRDFYKLPNKDILVIHDDMALPFGTIRTRFSGSSAGNNGVKSLNEHLGEDYARIRIGIWSQLRENVEARDFVLAKLTSHELRQLQTQGSELVKHVAMEFIELGELGHHTSKLELNEG